MTVPTHPGDGSETDPTAVREIADRLAVLGVSEDALRPVRDWVRDREAGKPERAYFFGCWGGLGHYLWTPSGRKDRDLWNNVGPFDKLDGTYTPKCHYEQSDAAIHHADGWTLLAFHDYSVDTRGKSNGAFIFDADLSFDGAVTEAAEWFPAVAARVGELRLHTCTEMSPRR